MAPRVSDTRATNVNAQQPQQQSQNRKRKSNEAFGNSSTTPRASKRFQRLKPRTRQISQSLINAKWHPLPLAAQEQIRELFQTARRPVILSRRDEARRREAEAVLEHMVSSLEKRLPRMPFPPKSRAEHFDLDKLMDRNHVLESLLTPAMHSNEVLKDQIEKEEAELEHDRELLKRLERDSKAERAAREKQATKIHALLESGNRTTMQDDAKKINLRELEKPVSFENFDDLQPLLKQLHGHLDNMLSNAEQLRILEPSIRESTAALDDTLRKRGLHQQVNKVYTV